MKGRLSLKENQDITFQAGIESSIKPIETGGGDNTLIDIANKLDEQLTEAAAMSIDRSTVSVPSPWASFLTFNNMFFSREGEGDVAARAKALTEWRCLIMLVALKPVLNLDIEYVDIDLAYKGYNNKAKAFAHNLIAVTPKNNLFGEDAWKKIRLIKLNGKIIGAFSNTSLVCSSPNNISSSLVDYMEKKGFPKSLVRAGADETEKYVRFDFEKMADEIFSGKAFKCYYFLSWVDAVESSLRKISNNSNSIKVDSFINQLNGNFESMKEYINSHVDKWEIEDALEALKKEDVVNDMSKKFLEFSRRDFNCNYENAQSMFDDIHLVVDLTVSSIENQIRIKDMNVVTFEKLDDDIVNILSDSNVEIIRPKNTNILLKKEIFTDKIAVIQGVKGDETEHVITFAINGANYLFPVAPIRRDAMDKLFADNPYALRDSIKYTGSSDGKTIRVDIEFETISHEKIYLNTVYDGDKIVYMRGEDIPLISIWPYVNIYKQETNKKIKDGEERSILTPMWRKFNVYIHQIFPESRSRSKYEFSFKGKIDDINDMFRANAIGTTADGRKRSIAIKKYDTLPKYVYVKDGDLNQERGIILLKKPKEVLVNDPESCEVGFDFGTTSTTAFCKVSGTDDEPEFVELGNFFEYDRHNNQNIVNTHASSYLSHVLGNRLMSGETNSVYGVFFPGEKFYNRKAYPSIFIESNNSQDGPHLLLQHGSAVLSYKYNHVPIGDSTIDQDMKWNKRGVVQNNNQKHIMGYLVQMLTSVALYVLTSKRVYGTIDLRLSYPTALSKTASGAYKNHIKSVVGYINDEILNPDIGNQIVVNDKTSYKTESVAAAMNFMSKGGNFYACIDIGGGSSDISAWYKTNTEIKNIMQTSVNIASRAIFRPAFAEYIITSNPDPDQLSDMQFKIKECLGNAIEGGFDEKLRKAKQLYRKDRKEAVESIASEVEAVLFEYSEELKPFAASGSDMFERKILFGIYAMMYFTIRSVAFAIEKGNISRGFVNLRIFLAGNGSKLIDWISSQNITEIEKALTTIARDEGIINSNGTVQIIEPDKATLKTEAAKGLLLQEKSLTSTDAQMEKNEVVYNGGVINYCRENGEKDTFTENENLRSGDEADGKYERINNFYKGAKCDYVSAELDLNQMGSIKNLVSVFNDDIMDGVNVIPTDDTFWLGVFDSAEEILNEDVKNKQLGSTLMTYVKAVIENI